MRTTILRTPTVLLELEVHDGAPFVHCTVFDWSVSVYKDLKNLWESVKEGLRISGVTELFYAVQNEQASKFAEMFGFTLHKHANGSYFGYLKLGE